MSPRFDALGVIVQDMARTLAFYRRLGLEFPDGAEDQPHAEAVLGGGLRLMFDTEAMVASIEPGWSPPPAGTPQRFAIAFLCDSPADVDATYADLVGAGYEGAKEPFDAFWGQRYATVHDPDGHAVDLFAPLAGDE